MPTQYINEQANIYQLPPVDSSYPGKKNTQITIGDLHGNAMKLLFMLVKHGIVSNISSEEYTELVGIYQKRTDELTEEDLRRFTQILAKMEIKSESLIRLIGDELADRGSNDYFTLKILEKLQKHKVPVEILVSNHSIEFIEACEKQADFKPPMLMDGHAKSLQNLENLILRGLVSREGVIKIAEKAYKPSLRALSYSLNADKSEIYIYSHAGIGLNNIQALAEKFEVSYQDTTASELAQTIDLINQKFQQHVQAKTLNTLYLRQMMEIAYDGNADLTNDPLTFIMWNRNYDGLKRPDQHFNYKPYFVHGHDSSDIKKNNVTNLDNQLGKAAHLNIGEYTVLYTVDSLEAPAPIVLKELQKKFLSMLEEMNDKQRKLRKRGYIQAADEALEVYTVVEKNYSLLLQKNIDGDTFRDTCLPVLKKARPELEKYRGWKQIVENLALAVIGLGVFYIAAGLINLGLTGKFLFFQTDSADKLDQLQKGIESITTQSLS